MHFDKKTLRLRDVIASNNQKKINILVKVGQNVTVGCMDSYGEPISYNAKKGSFDPIGYLYGGPIYEESRSSILDEESKPIFNKIAERFNMELVYSNERQKFLDFLDEIQHVHDVLLCDKKLSSAQCRRNFLWKLNDMIHELEKEYAV